MTVYSDDKWLRFILDQLIVNAVKYSREHPVLYFYTKAGRSDFSLVEDHGIGICANDLPRILRKVLRGKWTYPAKCNGIGLYLCKRLCDKLGIGIAAQSGETGNDNDPVLSNQSFYSSGAGG